MAAFEDRAEKILVLGCLPKAVLTSGYRRWGVELCHHEKLWEEVVATLEVSSSGQELGLDEQQEVKALGFLLRLLAILEEQRVAAGVQRAGKCRLDRNPCEREPRKLEVPRVTHSSATLNSHTSLFPFDLSPEAKTFPDQPPSNSCLNRYRRRRPCSRS